MQWKAFTMILKGTYFYMMHLAQTHSMISKTGDEEFKNRDVVI